MRDSGWVRKTDAGGRLERAIGDLPGGIPDARLVVWDNGVSCRVIWRVEWRVTLADGLRDAQGHDATESDACKAAIGNFVQMLRWLADDVRTAADAVKAGTARGLEPGDTE